MAKRPGPRLPTTLQFVRQILSLMALSHSYFCNGESVSNFSEHKELVRGSIPLLICGRGTPIYTGTRFGGARESRLKNLVGYIIFCGPRF